MFCAELAREMGEVISASAVQFWMHQFVTKSLVER